MAAEHIENLVRGADSVQILAALPGTLATDEQAIYNYSGSLIHLKKDGTDSNLLPESSDKVKLTIVFNKIKEGILGYTITGKLNEQNYEISKDVYLLRINDQIEGESSGKAIVFKGIDDE